MILGHVIVFSKSLCVLFVERVPTTRFIVACWDFAGFGWFV